MNELKGVVFFLLIVVLIFGGAYIDWWRCGEMFPNAQFACFIGGK